MLSPTAFGGRSCLVTKDIFLLFNFVMKKQLNGFLLIDSTFVIELYEYWPILVYLLSN